LLTCRKIAVVDSITFTLQLRRLNGAHFTPSEKAMDRVFGSDSLCETVKCLHPMPRARHTDLIARRNEDVRTLAVSPRGNAAGDEIMQ
jgi:hypothetical protein